MQNFINGILFRHKCDLERITFNHPISSDVLEKTLQRYGVVVIKNIIDRNKAIDLGEKLREKAMKAKEELGENNYFEGMDYYAQCELEKFRSYNEISQAGKPVLNIRSRIEGSDDGGFIDFFDIQNIFSKLNIFNEVNESLEASGVPNIVSKFSGFARQQMNLYINDGITQTRGPHIDNMNYSYKCFLYLSDVNNLNNGPYTYVPESHKRIRSNKLNIYFNKLLRRKKITNIPVPNTLPLRILGNAGTLIVSCQSGIHGGFPQSSSAKRTVLVDNFY